MASGLYSWLNCRCFLFLYTKYDKNKTPTDKTAAIAMMLTEIVEPVSNKKKNAIMTYSL